MHHHTETIFLLDMKINLEQYKKDILKNLNNYISYIFIEKTNIRLQDSDYVSDEFEDIKGR